MPRTRALTAAFATAAIALAGLTAPGAAGVTRPADQRTPASTQLPYGGPGKWTKVSQGNLQNIDEAGLYRTPDGVLHLVYNRDGGTAGYDRLSHTAISKKGAILSQNNVTADWSGLDNAPAVVGDGATGLRVLFGGVLGTAGFWNDGRMYTATAPQSGSPWTLPAQAVGLSNSAFASYGTSGVALADGTPIAAFPLNSTLTWHVGTGPGGDQTQSISSCCAYDTAMVRSGSDVYLAWYANGSTKGTNGTFVKKIYPSTGAVKKAPGSSQGTSSIQTGRVAMTARKGGGVFLAYCVGYPTCTALKLWKRGTTKSVNVPGGKGVTHVALAFAPKGRIWVVWTDYSTVHAMRTGTNGLHKGAVVTLTPPAGYSALYNVAVEGSNGRADIVINTGSALYHAQVLPRLSLHASPKAWPHGTAKKVVFTVTDAGKAIGSAKVKVGTKTCRTNNRGKCSLRFPSSFRKGKHAAKATKAGYTAGRTVLRVK